MSTVQHHSRLDMNWVTVCDISDLKANAGVCALVGEKQVAIFYLEREASLYAIDNFDPIGKANVLARGVVGDIKGQVVVASPLYKQHFNLETGQCLEKDSVKVATYPVRLEGSAVQIGS